MHRQTKSEKIEFSTPAPVKIKEDVDPKLENSSDSIVEDTFCSLLWSAEKKDLSLKIIFCSKSDVLLEGVQDIDKYDNDDAQCCTDYVDDIMQNARKKEKKLKSVKQCLIMDSLDHIHEKRVIVLDWIIEVCVKFCLLSESFFTCTELFDMCYQSAALREETNKPERTQLIGITCLSIASKVEETYAPVVRDYLYICDGAYTKEEFVKMERKILTTVKFEVYPPTSLLFLRRFSKAAMSDAETHTMSKYLCEYACLSYHVCQKFLPSQIAAGTILISRIVYKLEPLITITMEHYFECEKEVALEAAIAIITFVEQCNKKALKKKYSQPKLLEVATRDTSSVLPRLRMELTSL